MRSRKHNISKHLRAQEYMNREEAPSHMNVMQVGESKGERNTMSTNSRSQRITTCGHKETTDDAEMDAHK